MTDPQSSQLFKTNTLYIQHKRPNEHILGNILNFPINTIVMRISPGRSLTKSLGMVLQFMGLVFQVQYLSNVLSPVSLICHCPKCFYFTCCVYDVEQNGSSCSIFSTEGACHRNTISSRHQLLGQVS